MKPLPIPPPKGGEAELSLNFIHLLMKQGIYIGIDVGGTWLKGVACHVPLQPDWAKVVAEQIKQSQVQRVPSHLGSGRSVEEFIQSLDELLDLLSPPDCPVLGIGISTAGIVDYAGKRIPVASPHLGMLPSSEWKEHLEQKCQAPVVLINDADATTIGAVSCGYLQGERTIGIMPIGTGVGLSIWRNGRRWQPGKVLPLIGSVETPCGSFDTIGGIAGLSAKTGSDLCALLTENNCSEERERYLSGLAMVVYSACVLYNMEQVWIGGGLASAASACGYALGEELTQRITKPLETLGRTAKVGVLKEGNMLPLTGAVSLAIGEKTARDGNVRKTYDSIQTETPYDANLSLHKMNAQNIVEYLWNTEQEAGRQLHESLPQIVEAAQTVARKLSEGGRLIYVGAGTSGRLAAIDNVELGCTFGFPKEKVLTLIAGGVADASLEIESDFEEDASAVPEILLAQVSSKDVVVGISVSGSAYYVRSALTASHSLGASTVFIQEGDKEVPSWVDINIALRSGHEVVAGSTRMKAGTATKKVLNFISTTAMIRMGKVHGPYMIGLECINEKLIHRAQTILNRLYGLNGEEAGRWLARHGNNLQQAIEALENKNEKL